MHRNALLCSLILSAAVSAQTTATFVTDSDVGMFANNGTTAVLKATAKGTSIKPGTPLTLSARSGDALAGTNAALFGRNGRFSINIASNARVDSGTTNGSAGTAATTDPNSLSQAPHSFLFTITNPGFKSLDVTMTSRLTGKATGSISVDIGANGSVEFKQAADGLAYRKSFPFTGTSVKVRVTLDGSAGPGTAYSMNVMIGQTNPNPGCIISRYGRPCPRATLNGRDRPASGEHVLTLQIANAIASAPIALVVGGVVSNVRLPGSRCFLLTVPLVILPLTADSTGKASLTLKFAGSIKGTAYLQAIPYDPTQGTIMGTNGLRVDCL